jgi:uncharacterized protein (DUF1810 family)
MAEDLQRFVDAQRGVIERALDELGAGLKRTHWMWFVFPQLRGLGRSEMAHRYGIDGLAEAQAYLAHAELGPRLLRAVDAMVAARGSAAEILGEIDAKKLRSSATLFLRATPDEPRFQALLDRFFGGEPDPMTDALLAREHR